MEKVSESCASCGKPVAVRVVPTASRFLWRCPDCRALNQGQAAGGPPR